MVAYSVWEHLDRDPYTKADAKNIWEHETQGDCKPKPKSTKNTVQGNSNKMSSWLNLLGIKGNLEGRNGRSMPFWIFESRGFMLVASTFTKTSSLFGVGTGTSTCCKKQRCTHNQKGF